MTSVFYVTIFELKTNFLFTNYAYVRMCSNFSKFHTIYCFAYLGVSKLTFVCNAEECQFCPQNSAFPCQHERYAAVQFTGALRYILASFM